MSIFAAFLLGLLCGSVFLGRSAQAAQTFGPDTVKSAPKSFLKGGDRSAALLSEMLTLLRENTETVKKIESHARDINAQTKKMASQAQDE